MLRNKNLYRAAELTADYEKLVAWQALSRSAKQALYASHKKTTPRMNLKRIPGWIRIFGTANGLLAIQKSVPSLTGQPAAEPDATPLVDQLIALVDTTNQRVLVTAPADAGINILSGIKKFKFAKLSLIKVTGQATATGRVFGVGYSKVTTETVSTPFGRGTAGETYLAAVTAIKGNAAYASFIATSPAGVLASNRIVIYPEEQTS